MIWPFHKKTAAKYWLKVFFYYAVFEAGIQLLFYFTLNTFNSPPISVLEFHFIMWVFQCLLIWPIWYIAFIFRKQQLWIQIIANTIFFVLYTSFWYEIVQQWIEYLYFQLPGITQRGNEKLKPTVDSWNFFHYQVLKHALRLGWFYVAAFFYHYKKEEQQRLQLAVANKELQLNLMKWHLNPEFYFKTLNNISSRAKSSPIDCSNLILILSQVMEYVIYRSKEKFVPANEELAFLQNYIYLQNLDKTADQKYLIRITGDYNHLQIIPLLLVSLVENRIQHEKNITDNKLSINIFFEDHNMRLNIQTGEILEKSDGAEINGPLLMRLKEFYINRYRVAVNNGMDHWFEIQLNEIT